MNKALGLLLSVIVCGTMLTACKPAEKINDETTTVSETTTASETSAVSESTTASEPTIVSETTTASEPTIISETTATPEPTYISNADSYRKFVDANITLGDGKEIGLKESKTYALVQEIKDNSAFYISVTSVYLNKHAADAAIQLAVNNNDIAYISESEQPHYDYIHGMTLTTYYPHANEAKSRTLDQETYDALGLTKRIFSLLKYPIPDDADEASFVVKSYMVDIDGNSYTYETIKSTQQLSNQYIMDSYYVYDINDNLYMCGSGDLFYLTVIDKITYDVPPNIFVQPSGYSITNLDNEAE